MSRPSQPQPPAPTDAWAMVGPTPAELAAVARRLDPGEWAALAARFVYGAELTRGERALLVAEVQRLRAAELERAARGAARAD
jgi:hypothetical protein